MYIEDDIATLPADRSAITDLHYEVRLSRFGSRVPPREIFGLTNLRRLVLDCWAYVEIPDDITALTELRSLTIESSRFSTLPPTFGALSKLESLAIVSESFKTIPECILALPNLRELKICSTLDAVIDLSPLVHLETLWMSAYKYDLPRWIERLPALRELRIFDAKPRLPLPDWLWSFGQLRRLGLQYSATPEHQPKLEAMPQLEGLWLQNNELSGFPAAIGSMRGLESLEIDSDVVGSFPASLLREGSRLNLLGLTRTKLRDVPPEIARLSELRTLDLSKNALKAVPEELASLRHLVTLRLGENEITALPRALGNLTELEELDVHKNKIAAVPESVGALKKVTRARFNANRIAELPKSFFSLPAIRSLDLANNLLAAVPTGLARLGTLEELLLQSNPATKGQKNKAAEALLNGIRQNRGRSVGKSDGHEDDNVADAITLRARLEVADMGGARELAGSQGMTAALVGLLDDRDAKVRARALGLLAEVLDDPFAQPLKGVRVSLVGVTKGIKMPALEARLAKAGAALHTSASGAHVIVLGEKPSLGALPEETRLAALPQLQDWLVREASPHLMAPAAQGESAASLGELLRSAAHENVLLGFKLAEDGGVPTPLLPLVLALARAHADAKIRKRASQLFDVYAPAPLKLAVAGALGRNTLTQGLDNKADKAYRALAASDGFDARSFALEVLRLSGVGLGFLLGQPAPWGIHALRAMIKNGTLDIERHARFAALPDEIGELCDQLVRFRLGTGEVTSLPPSFAKLERLEELDLDRTKLTAFPDELRALPKLRVLTIQPREWPSIDGLADLMALEELHVEYGSLPIPASVGKLTKLRRLTWHAAPEVPRELGDLPELESLDVAGGRLTTLPPELARPPIKRLVLRGNAFTELPATIFEMKSLEHLDLTVCKNLREIPERLGTMTNLTELDLVELHQIKSLPPMPFVKALSIAYTKLDDPVAALRPMKSLERLRAQLTPTQKKKLLEAFPGLQLRE